MLILYKYNKIKDINTHEQFKSYFINKNKTKYRVNKILDLKIKNSAKI